MPSWGYTQRSAGPDLFDCVWAEELHYNPPWDKDLSVSL